MRTLRTDAGPLLWVAATIAGVIVGTGMGVDRSTRWCLVAGAVGLLLAFMRRRLRTVSVAACCFGVAISCAARASDGVSHHALVPLLREPRLIVLRGAVKDDPRPGRFATTVLVRASTYAIAGPNPVWRPVHRTVLLRAASKTAAELDALAAGDTIEVEGEPRALKGYDARMVWEHAVARVDVAELLSFRTTRSPYLALANRLRSILERGMAPLGAADRALLAGFLLGDTRAVDGGTVADFRASGLSHLLAVSGANVAFVLALVGPLQRRLPTFGRFLVGVAVVVVFAAMTRFEPSVLRAGAMALIVMTARAGGRPVHALRSLCYAVVALLVVDPFLLHSVGFQLSASACAGIALLARPIERRLPGPQWMRTVLAVTVAAQIGVAPVLVAVFGSVAWIAPAANLLAVPAAEPITVLAIPIAVFGAWAPLAARAAFVPVVALLWWTREVAHLGARSPLIIAGAALALVVSAAQIGRRGRRNREVASPV